MRYWSIVLMLMFVPVAAGAETRIRPLDALSSDTYAIALERSAAVRALVEHLESTNVIVHIESSRALPYGIGGTTRFVTSRGGNRYLRITLATDLPIHIRSAILGHELQHAREVADSPADDAGSMRELFESEGHRSGEYFETSAAIRIEDAVRMELRAAQRLRGLPADRSRAAGKFDR